MFHKTFRSNSIYYGLVVVVLAGLIVSARQHSVALHQVDEDDDKTYERLFVLAEASAALSTAELQLERIGRNGDTQEAETGITRLADLVKETAVALSGQAGQEDGVRRLQDSFRKWDQHIAQPALRAAGESRPGATQGPLSALGQKEFRALRDEIVQLRVAQQRQLEEIEAESEGRIWRANWAFGGASLFALVLTFCLALKLWLEEGRLTTATKALRGQMHERETAEANQRLLVEGMRAVLVAADEVLLCPDTDSSLRLAVESAREKFGVERCSVFLLENEGQLLRGTYGTDLKGRTTDEREIVISPESALRGEMPSPEGADTRWKFLTGECLKRPVDGDSGVHGARSWLGVTPILSSRGVLGYFFNDNGISGGPCNPLQQDLLASFASSLGRVLEIHEQRDELRVSEERSRTLLKSLPQKVFFKDANGVFVLANEKFCAAFGSSREEIVGKTDFDLQPAELAEKYLADDRRLMAERRSEVLEETALVRGEIIYVETVKAPVVADDGQVLGILGLITDITERKAAQHALQKANEELESRVAERTADLAASNQILQLEIYEREVAEIAAQKAREEAEEANRAKSEFLSRMSHELRTPLNAIIGFAQILDAQNLEEKQKRRVGYILSGGEHLLQLIDEVLDFARIDTGRLPMALGPVDLHAALSQVVTLMLPAARERGVQLGVVPEDARISVRADAERLKQVLVNLVANAIKYNRPGGLVSFRCLPISPGEQEGSGPRIRLEVRDTGPGIDPEKMSRLFTPFDRLGAENTNVPGTGLGLSLAQRLVRAMNGDIGAQSELGAGSTFWVELPLAVVSGPQRFPTWSNGFEASIPASTVLYIEDNLSNLHLIDDIFSDLPRVRLMTALEGQMGLDLARQYRPDLILLDLNLPDIMGWDVLRMLREDPRTADIPVIVVSADATVAQQERLMSEGADAYFTKPFDVTQLMRTVREYVGPSVDRTGPPENRGRRSRRIR